MESPIRGLEPNIKIVGKKLPAGCHFGAYLKAVINKHKILEKVIFSKVGFRRRNKTKNPKFHFLVACHLLILGSKIQEEISVFSF